MYVEIYDIKINKENVTTMSQYDPSQTMDTINNHLDQNEHFERYSDQIITDAMIISKGIKPLSKTGLFKNDLKDLNLKPTQNNIW